MIFADYVLTTQNENQNKIELSKTITSILDFNHRLKPRFPLTFDIRKLGVQVGTTILLNSAHQNIAVSLENKFDYFEDLQEGLSFLVSSKVVEGKIVSISKLEFNF